MSGVPRFLVGADGPNSKVARALALRAAASIVYFHHQGVFDPAAAADTLQERPNETDGARMDAKR